MKILGASLGELLRHGSQFGLGVQAAGRQNVMDQQAMDKARREELQQALVDQAQAEYYKANAEESRARGRSLDMPEAPKAFNPQQTIGRLRQWMSEHPGATYQDALAALQNENPGRVDPGVAYDEWMSTQRQQEQDKRTQENFNRINAPSGPSTTDAERQARALAHEAARPKSNEYPDQSELARQMAILKITEASPGITPERAGQMFDEAKQATTTRMTTAEQNRVLQKAMTQGLDPNQSQQVLESVIGGKSYDDAVAEVTGGSTGRPSIVERATALKAQGMTADQAKNLLRGEGYSEAELQTIFGG